MKQKFEKPLTIVFMGIQGSGKGTQAEEIAKKYDVKIIEAGGLLRAEVDTGSKLGKKIDTIINKKGELVPDEITKELIANNVAKVGQKESLIIDGYPRTMVQVKDLAEILKNNGREDFFVVDIVISEELAIKRLSSRLICKDCAKVGKVGVVEECPECGKKMTQREDDMPEKIKERLKWSKEKTGKVMDFYEDKGILYKIDGELDKKEVTEAIEDLFQKKVNKL